MSKLRIAENLTLPLEAVTQTFGILGKRGGGKSYTAKVMAEEMLKADAHICAVDPIGNWWGLRVAADGKSPGLPITVLGGDYGDIPLEAGEKAGEFVARLIVEEKLSLVIDLSKFRKGEQLGFMIGWAETLYRLNREPLHLFIDEADAFAPQRPLGNLAPRLLGAMEDLVRRGRARGLGMTMITQRSASINKDLLTQIEVLIAKRTIAPQDRAAIEAWVEVHGTPEQQKTMMASLPSLPLSEAWLWSPGWLDLFKRVVIRKLETLDSSATPEVGKRRVVPRKLADVDLAKLQERMATTIEKAKAEDPRELRKRIAELERKLAEKLKPAAAAAPDPAALEKAEKKGYERAVKEARRTWEPLAKAVQSACRILQAVSVLPSVDVSILEVPPRRADPPPPDRAIVDRPAPRPQPKNVDQAGSLGKGERRILAAIAQYPGGASRQQLTVLTGYKRSSRDTYLQRLQQWGLVLSNGSGLLTASPAGVDALGDDYEPLPRGEDLRDYWRNTLPEGERRILEALMEAYPQAVDRDNLSESTGYKRSSRDTYLQRLGARLLVTSIGRGEVRASDELFEE